MIAHERVAEMANGFSGTNSISEADWVAAIEELGKRTEEKEIFVQILWPRGQMNASVYRPHVSERTFHVYLRPQSLGGYGDLSIDVQLPERGEEMCEFWECRNETDVYLSLIYDHLEFQIATSLEFLALVTNDSRVQ